MSVGPKIWMLQEHVKAGAPKMSTHGPRNASGRALVLPVHSATVSHARNFLLCCFIDTPALAHCNNGWVDAGIGLGHHHDYDHANLWCGQIFRPDRPRQAPQVSGIFLMYRRYNAPSIVLRPRPTHVEPKKQPTNQLIDQPINQPTNPPTNQPTNKSTTHPTNQPTHQR